MGGVRRPSVALKGNNAVANPRTFSDETHYAKTVFGNYPTKHLDFHAQQLSFQPETNNVEMNQQWLRTT